MAKAPVFQVRGLSFAYRPSPGAEPVRILDGLDFEIQPGEFVAIRGPSGSGKSTLLYILGGLLRSYTGGLEFEGRPLAELGDSELALLRNRKIGYIFQQFYLLPKSTVLENILLPTVYPTEFAAPERPMERARAIAASLGLGEKLDAYPNQLSGGQQQRVAIARALVNDPEVLFADEPTGSLDSKTSAGVMEILKAENQKGKTIILITHDPEVAAQANRQLLVRDGKLISDAGKGYLVPNPGSAASRIRNQVPTRIAARILPIAWKSITENRLRSALNMIGVVIGVAALLAMLTLGEFTKARILDSYKELGASTFSFDGYRNWNMRASDKISVMFTAFDWKKDILALKKIFPQIDTMSPNLNAWGMRATYSGRSLSNDVDAQGISEDGLKLLGHKLVQGKPFNDYHIRNRVPVCIIGSEVARQLFKDAKILGEVMFISSREVSSACRVVGVLKSGSRSGSGPGGSEIILPYTFLQSIVDDWSARIQRVLIRVHNPTDVVPVGQAIERFFTQKYGVSGEFRISSNSVLLAQMEKFLSLFKVLLGVIASISLLIGGLGIANMMLVSVTERLKEIGIRKTYGATRESLRAQYLLESVLLCAASGLIGLALGFAAYELAIFGASFVVPGVDFQWLVYWPAVALSFLAILIVGVASGIVPALKAERLEVIEALRAD